MYEKPQYFTPDGFKRLSKNPYSEMSELRRLKLLKKKWRFALMQRSLKKKYGATISDEAAACLAHVLKGMLNSRH
jgi:hypothetical protein